MPVQLYVAGPCDIFVGTGTSGALEALGFTEDEVGLSVTVLNRPVRVSISGDMMQFDSQYMGLEMRFSIPNLNYYDETVVRRLLATDLGNVDAPFSIPPNSIGAFKRQEGVGGFRCLLRNRYGLGQPGFHPGMATMIPVVNIVKAELDGPQNTQFGTKNRTWQLSVKAIPVFNPATGAAVLANFDGSGIPSVVYV